MKDRKAYGAHMMLFDDLAKQFASNPDTWYIFRSNLPKAVDQGIFKIEYEWREDIIAFRTTIWSPTENMYKQPADTNKLEEEMMESMLAYFFSTN